MNPARAGTGLAARRRCRGLALPGTLLMLTLMALAMAAAQRGAVLQWRAARWECTRLQAREDAWAALRAAQAWVDAQGRRLRVQDCSNPLVADDPGDGRLCAQAPGAPGDASWTRLSPGTQPCTQTCAYHVQLLQAPGVGEDARDGSPVGSPVGSPLPPALRLSAWAGGPSTALLQLDLQLHSRPGQAPRYVPRAWRALR